MIHYNLQFELSKALSTHFLRPKPENATRTIIRQEAREREGIFLLLFVGRIPTFYGGGAKWGHSRFNSSLSTHKVSVTHSAHDRLIRNRQMLPKECMDGCFLSVHVSTIHLCTQVAHYLLIRGLNKARHE